MKERSYFHLIISILLIIFFYLFIMANGIGPYRVIELDIGATVCIFFIIIFVLVYAFVDLEDI